MKLFEAKAREIFRYVRPYQERGIVTPSVGKVDSQSAIRMRYADFAEAQTIIIEELRAITARRRDLAAQIKDSRKSRDKSQTKRFERELAQEKWKEDVIRKLADSIAWQLIDGRSEFVKWLYSYESPPAIDESNATSVIAEICKLNQADQLSFALMSDLTSFVQVGDILRQDTSGIIEVIEVKEGKENLRAMRILETELLGNQNETSLERLRSIYGSHLMDQALRIQRQVTKSDQVKEIINIGRGEDPKTGTRVIVQGPRRVPPTYTSKLAECLLRLDKETGVSHPSNGNFRQLSACSMI